MPAIRILVWDEGTAPPSTYAGGLGAAIAAGLREAGGGAVTVTGPLDPDQGTSPAVLAEADVLVWWSHHATAAALTDRAAARVAAAVRDRGVGFVALHSAYLGKPFRLLMGTPCVVAGGEDAGLPESVKVVSPDHPVAAGVADFVLPREETYREPFQVPEPEAVVFESRFGEGEASFRSGMAWTRGQGRVFYFRPGHEAYPVYRDPAVRRVVANAVRWCGRRGAA